MIHSVNIRTDDRVADIVRHFEAAPGWEVIGAIDSVNWGEGYDLRWRGVPVRLHDDVRSDEVMRRSRGICEPEEWSQLFQIVAGEMSGEVELTVAIDYWGEASPELYPAVAEAIRAVLVRAGYNQASIRAEASC